MTEFQRDVKTKKRDIEYAEKNVDIKTAGRSELSAIQNGELKSLNGKRLCEDRAVVRASKHFNCPDVFLCQSQ